MECAKNCEKGLMFGEYQSINKFLAINKANLDKRWSNLVGKARDLISIEINSGNPHVGFPIDILLITKDGATWIQRKPECKEAKEMKPNLTSTEESEKGAKSENCL